MIPSQIRLKVCGMRDSANIRAVAELGPDYMGFIFYRGSRRYVGDDFVMPDMQDRIKRVGVFVDQSTAEIKCLAQQHRLDFIQLHGKESPAQCAGLVISGLKVIKAFSIGSEVDFAVLEPYRPYIEFALFDTAGHQAGGNGVGFDWKLLKQYDQSIPFFLAGGLSPARKDWEIPKGMNMHALDVNSGVEVEPGMKNVSLVKEMLNVRNQWL
ncbi:MAG TPA: phosphoribosylanthranilate isomerase [Cyclobacteriaceae bacterium]|nr:phosphoribosylanthranilate isomerase [Cyclobacteriaceae bacterium]